MKVVRAGFDDVGAALEHGAQQAIAGHDVINKLEAGAGLDEQRDDGPGKNHDVGQAENGEVFREGTGGNARRHLGLICPQDADKLGFRRWDRRFHK